MLYSFKCGLRNADKMLAAQIDIFINALIAKHMQIFYNCEAFSFEGQDLTRLN